MKHVMSFFQRATALCLLNAAGLYAQSPRPEDAPKPDEPALYDQAQQAFDQAARAQDEAARVQEAAAQNAKRLGEQVEANQLLGGLIELEAPGGGETVVISSSQSDAKEQSDLEEDMAVMQHILEKAVSDRPDAAPRAMGIDVVFGPHSNPLRSLYIENYGALFMLHAGFPLMAPPAAPSQKEKRETNSAWEDAWRDLYGRPDKRVNEIAPAEPYDEERVNRLRDGLLDALQNSTNIRGLKPDDAITVCVFGTSSPGLHHYGVTGASVYGANPGFYPNNALVYSAGGQGLRTVAHKGRLTVLTIRIKKSDAELLAKGTLTLEAFRKRAHIATYATSANAGRAALAPAARPWFKKTH